MLADHDHQQLCGGCWATFVNEWVSSCRASVCHLLGVAIWLLALMPICACVGCASWSNSGGESGVEKVAAKTPSLPTAKVPDEAAIVDIAFLEMPTSTVVDPRNVPWEMLDEAVVPIEVRTRLEENGFKVGRIVAFDVTQMPQASEESESQVASMGWTSDFDRRVRRLACIAGKPYKLVLRRPSDGEIATLIRGEAGIAGRSLWNPQFNLSLHTTRMDDGRVAVKLVPEIHHGEIKRSYISNDSLAFRMDNSRDVWVLDDLAIEVPLDEGQAVVILPQDDVFGLAKQMLVGRKADDSEERTAVVVHLSRRPRSAFGGSL